MSRVIHFDIPADDPQRAIKFYQQVFGWKIEKWGSPTMDYWLVMTGDSKEPGIDGGLSKRSKPDEATHNSISVPSVDDFSAKITANGGKILMPKSPIPGVGYMAFCVDTEGNPFGIIEMDEKAK